MASPESPAAGRRLSILAVYAQPRLWSMGDGAGSISFTGTLESLAGRGHEVHVSLPAGEGENEGAEGYRGFTLHRRTAGARFVPRASLPSPLRLWERYRSWIAYQHWAVAAALEVARTHPPDLLLALGSFEAPVASRVARKLGVPNVTRLYGCWLRLDDRKRFYANFPEILAFRAPADLLLVTNDGSRGDEAARRLKVSRDRFVFVRNGLDFDRFRPGPGSEAVRRRLGVEPDQPLLVTVTRLAPEKRLERALGALSGLIEKVPRSVLALVGDGPDRETLESRAAKMGLGAHVRFPGPVEHDRLPEWYRTADLLLSLLDRTNASNPVFEAMACGRVPVVLDSGATREVVAHGRTGIVVRSEELPALGGILADLLLDPARRERLGAAAAQAIRELLPGAKERMSYETELLEAAADRRPIGRLPGS